MSLSGHASGAWDSKRVTAAAHSSASIAATARWLYAQRAVAAFTLWLAAILVLPSPAAAQDNPALHKRSAAQAESTRDPLVATGRTDLPEEAEGDYPWDKQGSEIDLFFEDGRLHGYMTEHLDPDPHVAPAVFDFATTHIEGHAVTWTTRVVHGTSYSFDGHLERGLVASPDLPGYYLLTGTLTVHGGQADGQARIVRLKREPGA